MAPPLRSVPSVILLPRSHPSLCLPAHALRSWRCGLLLLLVQDLPRIEKQVVEPLLSETQPLMQLLLMMTVQRAAHLPALA